MTSWTTPKTWTGVALPSSEMNTYVRDNSNYAKERLSHYINAVSTDVTKSSTLAEETLWSYSVPGNEMTSTGIMNCRFIFIVTNNKGTTGTVTFKFYVGANSWTFINATSVTNGSTYNGVVDLWIRGDGTTSLQRLGGEYAYTNGGAGASTGFIEATTATDITTSQTWKITGTMNASSASFITTCRFAGLTYNLMTI